MSKANTQYFKYTAFYKQGLHNITRTGGTGAASKQMRANLQITMEKTPFLNWESPIKYLA